MNVEQIFTGIGIVFLIITIGYFVGSYLNVVSSIVKVGLSFCASIALFVLADILRGSNR